MKQTSEAFEYNLKLPTSKETRHTASAELVLLIIIEVSGFILNSVVLLILYLRFKYLQDKTRYILLGNILLCDFILLCFIIPTSMKFASCEIESCRALVLESFCSSITLLFEFSYICALCTQACLSIDTVLKVRVSCGRFLSRRNYWTVVGISWVFSLLPTIISRLPTMNRENFTFYVDLQRCADYDPSQCFYQIYILSFLHVVVAPFIPGCYFYLAAMAHRLKTRLNTRQSPNLSTKSEEIIRTRPSSRKDNSSISFLADSELSQSKTSGISKSVLEDIRHLFRLSQFVKTPKKYQSSSLQPNFPSVSNTLTPNSRPIERRENLSSVKSENLRTTKQPQQTPQMPLLTKIDSNSPIKGLLQVSESIIQELSHMSIESHSQVRPVVAKSTQTSFFYESNSSESEVSWSSSCWSGETPISVPQTWALYQPNLSNKVSAERIDSSSFDSWHEQHLSLHERVKKMRSESPNTLLRPPSKGVLNKAVFALCQHGLLLMTLVYGCSVPYVLVSTCSRLNLPWPSPTIAVCLYYSTCVWYPLVYFFMSANFRKQLTMTTSGV